MRVAARLASLRVVTWQLLTTFALLCLLLALTPGPDSFLVLRYAMVSHRAGMAAALGSAVATLGWAAAVALGLAAVLEQSAVAFRLVKVAGGVYLLWLGVSTLVRHRRRSAEGVDLTPRSVVTSWSAARAGFLSTTLNPKVGLSFIAVVRQFLRDDHAGLGATMLLGSIMAVISVLYLSTLSATRDVRSSGCADHGSPRASSARAPASSRPSGSGPSSALAAEEVSDRSRGWIVRSNRCSRWR